MNPALASVARVVTVDEISVSQILSLMLTPLWLARCHC